jgi:CubicO group peptidase (beta-lactamase class C family)
MRDPASGELMPMPSMRSVPMERFYGGGDLLSTPRDYVRFLQCLVNGGELDGVRILSEASVESFFTNQLPGGMTLSHPLMEAMDRPANAPQRSIFDDQDTHSLAWTIEANPDERGYRPQGVGSWAGIFNTYYTIDRERGVVVVSFFQLLPFNDGEAYELYRVFEDLVYESVLE